MANYNCHARSNYFRVKDMDKFLSEFIDTLNLELIIDKDDTNLVGFLCDESGIPHFLPADDDVDQDRDVDFDAEIAKHLAEDSVAIYIEIGHEKLRCLNGYATAVNSKGDVQYVSLFDIYDKAKTMTSNPKSITLAEY